jgi:transposase
MRYLFLFNAEKLDEERQQELNALQKQQLRTIRAWGIKDYFRWFWDEPDAIAGREFCDHWYNWAIRSRLEPMKKVARILKNRLDNILSWFRHRITNSTAEGSIAASKPSSTTPEDSSPFKTTELVSSSSAENCPRNLP